MSGCLDFQHRKKIELQPARHLVKYEPILAFLCVAHIVAQVIFTLMPTQTCTAGQTTCGTSTINLRNRSSDSSIKPKRDFSAPPLGQAVPFLTPWSTFQACPPSILFLQRIRLLVLEAGGYFQL